ncbi:amidase domain-containing protein [Rathayibacter sp. KR2-224]|uniref:amidase domain-containing protein n=1 Tax=Rathayibacter sp. KR2-224 TaxID=3400913 RepID=UPI003C0E1E7B
MTYPPNESHKRHGRTRAIVIAVLAASVIALTGCTSSGAVKASVQKPASERTPAAAPSVAGVSPAEAPVVGQQVTITGTDLQNVKTVAFGSTIVPVVSATADKVVADAPAAADYQPATVGLKLISKTGKTVATKPNALEYTATGGVAAQLQYALAHWQNYNTAQYGDLNPDGGDCANFVSQTLIARGWTMNDDWYNHGAAADWSAAWGYVPAMDEYFADNAESLGLQKLSFSQADRAQVALGDIAVFDWDGDGSPDHVEVVDRITKVDGQYKIELASHNDDYAFRDLDETITTQHPGAIGHFWHLTR